MEQRRQSDDQKKSDPIFSMSFARTKQTVEGVEKKPGSHSGRDDRRDQL
jgi:hypothetical protein